MTALTNLRYVNSVAIILKKAILKMKRLGFKWHGTSLEQKLGFWHHAFLVVR